MGKTHMRVGALSYGILNTVTGIIVHKPALSIVPMLISGAVALFADADEKNSKVNRSNPVTGIPIKIVEKLERFLRWVVKLLLTFGLGGMLLYYSAKVRVTLSQAPFIGDNASATIYTAGIILILAGFISEGFLRKIPLLGVIYEYTSVGLHNGTNIIKRLLFVLIYSGIGMAVIWYNYQNGSSIFIYLMGFLLIAVALFPHRTVLHSVDGFIVFSLCAWYVLYKFQHIFLLPPVIFGYFSHLFLADVFTNSGIPLSMFPTILKATRLHNMLSKYENYSKVFNILDIRIRLPLMSTGSDEGNMFEQLYVFVLLVLLIAIAYMSKAAIVIL